MATPTQLMTADDLLRLPDNDMRHELVRGKLQEMPLASFLHGKITITVAVSLEEYVQEHNLGTVYAAGTGFKLATNPDTVRAPDVSFVRRERLQMIGDAEGYFPGAPDLAVEVISPNDLYTEVEDKVTDYLSAGTGMVIVVNPRKHTVTIYRAFADIIILTENDTIDGEDVVPGWTLAVRKVFE